MRLFRIPIACVRKYSVNWCFDMMIIFQQRSLLRNEPCFAGRFLEQQRQQLSCGESQQEQSRQQEQQQRVSLPSVLSEMSYRFSARNAVLTGMACVRERKSRAGSSVTAKVTEQKKRTSRVSIQPGEPPACLRNSISKIAPGSWSQDQRLLSSTTFYMRYQHEKQ